MDNESKSEINYLEIKDNGIGIHPVFMCDALTSFGKSSNISLPKNDFILCEHGMSLKLNALRLGDTVLIISKTKPQIE